jgi:GNAT superfamily N-acetyltransferase
LRNTIRVVNIRPAQESELDHLAQLWYDGWQDAHAEVVPDELKRRRTLGDFRRRLQGALPVLRVAGPAGAPVGFHWVKDDELYQLYVSAQARGTGIAAALVADAEELLRAAGVQTAWLGCAIGNNRAARFYQKCGWHLAGNFVERLETPQGEFPLEVWRYEKQLRPREGPTKPN